MGYISQVLYQSSLSLTLLILVISMIGGSIAAIELWGITRFIDEITRFTDWTASYLEVLAHFLPFIGAVIGAMLIRHVVISIQPYLATKLNEKISVYLHHQLFRKSMQLRLEVFQREDQLNKIERSKGMIRAELVYVLEDTSRMITTFVEFAVIVYAMSEIGMFYSFLLILCFIPILYFNIKASKKYYEVNYNQSQTRRKQAYWSGLVTRREAVAELRLLQIGNFMIQQWKKHMKTLLAEQLKARKKMAILRFQGEIFYLLLLFFLMGATVLAGVQGTISLGALVATLYLLNRLDDVMKYGSDTMGELAQFFFRFQVIPEFLQIEDEEERNGLPSPPYFKEGIEFVNVSFKYPGETKYALKNISFHLEPGERIALVGENGAGKSTLCLLLLGLYKPTEGRIFIDGKDLSGIDPVLWRKKAASVFQNYMRYQLTARENIGLGEVERIEDKERIRSAAVKSGIHSVIEQLPYKYETLLGKQYEESSELSGGEWQKLATSRAYFREAELLILDEPVSALDAHSEYAVYQQFSEMSKGKTVMIVSHRLGSARLSDRILLLKNGRLVEMGSHEQLLQAHGEYATLFRMQAEWYEDKDSKGEEWSLDSRQTVE